MGRFFSVGTVSLPTFWVAMLLQLLFYSLLKLLPIGGRLSMDVQLFEQIPHVTGFLLLEDLKKKFKMTYILISHDLSVVNYMSDKIAVMYLGKLMECGPSKEIFEKPVHPYTKALFGSIPDIHTKSLEDITTLEGNVPSPIHPPSGCYFHTRCPMARERCGKETPALQDICLNPPCGVLSAPITLTIENGYVKKVAGGSQAKQFESWLAHFNDPLMYRMAHVCYGLHPNAKLTGVCVEDERIWGSTEWGMGYLPVADAPPTGINAASHCDGITLNSSLWLDGVQVLDQGEIVHPELVEMAKKLKG
ncbi:hypothetical protein MUB23_17450 [Cuneatibacter sp. NSJ-177]|uniref:oligopeptide/dipeptide ABC transporter ATP-binding protein n=1 Tax=Cuneatibacter sp. NSJ-177 TaxID=2931401 RepID=UPI001FD1432F|nr:oligopeptide/dipeptide ABC transporter ATP-binding protein [Cuneatibacter sp. NSJ-177]MCJ7837163.1 hypothetical protein [Cuneatibacter sp. NSJ-177]